MAQGGRSGTPIPEGPYVKLAEPDENPAEGKDENQKLISALLQNLVDAPPPRTKCYVVGTNTLLIVTAGVSALLYIQPSIDYGNRQNSKAQVYLQVLGNTTTAAIVTWNVARIYAEFTKSLKELKQQLGRFLDAAILKQEQSETIPIWTLAAISALPLSIPAYQTSRLPQDWRIVQAFGIQFAYTGSHTFPIFLLLHDPLTRKVMFLPFYPFISLWNKIQYCRSTPAMLSQRALQEQIREDQGQLKGAIIKTFTSVTQTIIKHRGELTADKVDFLYKFSRQKGSLLELKLVEYLAYLETADPFPKPKQPGRCEKWLRRIAWSIGGSTMTMGVSGFVMSVFNQTKEWTGSSAAALFAVTLPLYVTCVITIYFGGNRLQTVPKEIPLAIKLYPQFTITLLAVTNFLSIFGSGTAAELVYDNFEPGPLQDVLAEYALRGVSLFLSANMLDFVFFLSLKWAKLWGSDDKGLAVRLAEQAERFAFTVERLDGQILETELVQLPSEQREKFCGLEEKEFTQLTKHRENLKKKMAENDQRYWFSFWKDGTLPKSDAVSNNQEVTLQSPVPL